MKKTIENLLKVKSLMSMAAIAMFIWLVVTKTISGEQAMTIISMVFTAYFVHTAVNKQAPSEESESELNEEEINKRIL